MPISRAARTAPAGRSVRWLRERTPRFGRFRLVRRDAGLETGVALVEVASALGIFALLILSVSLTLMRGLGQRRESSQLYRAQEALRILAADVQETANLPQDLASEQGIGAVYAKYHGKSFPVAELPSGQISVTVFGNETTVPSALGGPQDLNFDGDPYDDLGSSASGHDLKLVPMLLSLSFTEDSVARTVTAHRLITRTAGR